jgi:cobalt-zinc-cadmium efflux system outer membrane protein
MTVPEGALPPRGRPADAQTASVLVTGAPSPAPPPKAQSGAPYQLPPDLPGRDAPPIELPRFAPNTPQSERAQAVKALYPELHPRSATVQTTGTVLSLAELQQMAVESSPTLRRADAAANATYGAMVQAGVWPNPTVGYQADQWQPGPGPSNNSGQQGYFINQLIKTAGKLSLAQKVAGFDYLNSLVAARREHVNLMTAVRTQYFAVLVAQEAVRINAAVIALADEMYRLQLRQVAAGEAAPYEPLQLYAQAEQARVAYTQADTSYRAAWVQLAAAIGRPDLPPAPLDGSADAPAPVLDAEAVQARMLEDHTDLLIARNAIAQAQVNLLLQKRTPIPDVATNFTNQYDNATSNFQFGLQIGIALPVTDRNQGNIHQAASQLVRVTEDRAAIRNDLIGKLAEAFGRYSANRAIAERYRDKILPNLTRGYRALVNRYDVEPAKVGFNDIVVAQQNLAQALQAYLTALAAQWQAVVDVANLGQLDELYPAKP